jgi:multicomponent Na+:H+ antiporter subunit G
MMALLVDALSWFFLLVGGFFVVVGTIGLVRLPDFYTRLHAVGITDTLGAGLMLVGLALQAGFTLIAVKLILIALFLLVTSPTAAHALAKAALHGKLVPLTKKAGGASSTS